MYLPATFHPKLSKPSEFNRLLANFDADYSGKITRNPRCEANYRGLIQRYPHTGNNATFSNLLSDSSYLLTVWRALKEFGLGTHLTRPVQPIQFAGSIKNIKNELLFLNLYRMEDLVANPVVDQVIIYLRLAFFGLNITQTNSKLVYHSKALHFLLPDLIMPVDGAIVLKKGFNNDSVPTNQDAQFDRFLAVFKEYIRLTKLLGLTSNGWSDNYWNRSVPKRIDNVVWVL